LRAMPRGRFQPKFGFLERGVEAVSLLLLLGAIGCSRQTALQRAESSPRPPLAATDLARVGDVVISRQAFEREWERRMDGRTREQLLREMIRFETLLAQARASGVDRDPEVRAAFARMVVGKFEEEQLRQRRVDSVSVTEAEVRAYYESHPERFNTPRQIRLGLIQCKFSSKATSEKREELRQHATALWNQARQTNDFGFRQLALEHSEDQTTRYAGGDTGWMLLQQGNSRWGPEVLRAADALSTSGDLAPLLQTASGFFIVKLLGTQPAGRRRLEEVRDGIEYQLRLEKAQQIREAFFQEAKAGLTIEVNEAALESVPDHALHAATSLPPSLPK